MMNPFKGLALAIRGSTFPLHWADDMLAAAVSFCVNRIWLWY